MAALSSFALLAGIGSMAYGTYEKMQGQKKADEGYALQQQGAQVQAEAARQQAGISKEQAASSVIFAGQERDINLLASGQSVAASNQSYGINQGTIAAERAIEGQKKQAMELDARRQQMEGIRSQQRARAMSITTGVAQGGSGFLGASSARGGAYGQIAGQTNVNLLGISQNLQIGQNIFAQNEAISNNRVAQNDLEHQYALQQAANQTAKANLTYSLAQTNAAYQTRLADTQTLMSQGTGLVNRGGGLVNQGTAQQASGTAFFNAGPSIFNMGMNSNQLLGGQNYFGGSTGGPGYSPSPLMRMFT